MTDVLQTDVLVIGGGAAGSNAALKAADRGARVVMVVKGLLGKSGCSIFASHLPYHDVSTEQKARDRFRYSVRYYNHYLTDQEYVKRMEHYMRTEFYNELERMGVYWRRTDDGRLLASPNRVPVLVVHKQGASGVLIMDRRRKEIRRRGIPVFEESAVTALLLDDGRVVGATVLDCRTGRFFVVLAKATILATGHSDYLASRATATREQSADGIAMALRAGAELANLEIQWWHISDMLSPRAWMRMHLYPNPLLGTKESSRLYNAQGAMFFEQVTHAPGASAPYVEQIRRLAREVTAGRAHWDGDYSTGYDHIPQDVIKAYQRQAKVWDKLGLDVAHDRIECGITWHMRQGGVNVDTMTMATTRPGLHVAGGIACHYLGGVGPVSFDGKVAGEAAADAARSTPAPALPGTAVEDEQARLFNFLKASATGLRPIEVKMRIRDIMWTLGYVKNAEKLQAALAALRDLRDRDVPRMRLQSSSKVWNTGWIDALDACSMIDACEATVRSALRREESRGPFYREDYPFVDNENWLCKVIVSRTDDEWHWRKEPYALPYLAPEKAREAFFDADY
jgi:succinate dehydrogenase / fumarate reductase flavoprotein subunit